jgi:hypothetical protein
MSGLNSHKDVAFCSEFEICQSLADFVESVESEPKSGVLWSPLILSQHLSWIPLSLSQDRHSHGGAELKLRTVGKFISSLDSAMSILSGVYGIAKSMS